MDEVAARTLAQRLYERIELRKHSSGTDDLIQPQGVWGAIDYYKGKHSLRFASKEFQEFFEKQFSGFHDNWCAPVIDAAAERMIPKGIRLGPTSREADAEFERVMQANDAARGLSEAFTMELATGRAYVLVWGNPDDDETPVVSFEHPAFCAVARDAETGRVTAAAKSWTDEDDTVGYLTLYTPHEVWKWRWLVPEVWDARRAPNWADPDDKKDGSKWYPRAADDDDSWPIPNPMGVVPMVELRNSTLLDDRPLSDLAGVAAMQDSVNLIWAYLFNALDFVSLPQRFVTGSEPPKMPILDDKGQKIGEKEVDLKRYLRERVMFFGNADAKPGSWPAADPKPFVDIIGMAVDHISAQTRTPPHYLVGKMANMSGDALTVAETGLVAKVIQRQSNANGPLREVYRLIALAQGDKARAKAAQSGVIVWNDPQYRSLAQKADAFSKLRQAGLPLRYMLEWWGMDPNEVDRVADMADHEKSIIVTATPEHPAPGTVLPHGQNVIDAPQGTPAAATAPVPTPATGEGTPQNA